MSDRCRSITVVLDGEKRCDDVEEKIIPAMLMIKGVLNAKTDISDPMDFVHRNQIKSDLVEKLWQVLK